MKRLQTTIQTIRPPSRAWREKALERLRQQARPAGSLGMLEDIGARLAGIFETLDVRLDRKVIVTCAGDHGICEEGVSLFPSEVTPQMVHNFVRGGASINVLAQHAGAEVRVADLGVAADFDPDLPIFHKKIAKGTRNFAAGPAMTRAAAAASLDAGIDIVATILAEGPVHLFGTGDMGIGNTTPSTAIIAAYSGLALDVLTGRGTGVDDEGLMRKKAAIHKGLLINQPDPADALDVLAKVGGFEIGGIAGIVIGAAAHRIPVVCDGLIATAGALIACELAPGARDYLFASHHSVEVGHRYMLEHLKLEPLLDLRFRLGEGTGAAVAMELIDAATRVLADIKTFEEVAIADAQGQGPGW
ncbi:MAG: nicotinate-nucleotide--dimethylbenzimidazole phosphoribosyltransferase [Desulfobacterales bacterium]|nr:nicotinate-nucleotide--dimethylbenzimidazole phosphoribosyltransferase [Desulfobacterales bacterium]MDJ0855456.1 nicotinate-nucleotide--dimethylbenzimidazole phosphoribosyltransferase [Desulfobacterales bacterium]MDJ0886293.1 nicotinate-nucleotide--dimethylbenzimidazole phosphoribosyltransferase [Desulfobacterales bacterium]MDJ0988858.1 nicotinate-nucleotide--dimethylbenzimidazole phosphoribosyltransferase [Desulfobacterales bacterium]